MKQSLRCFVLSMFPIHLTLLPHLLSGEIRVAEAEQSSRMKPRA